MDIVYRFVTSLNLMSLVCTSNFPPQLPLPSLKYNTSNLQHFFSRRSNFKMILEKFHFVLSITISLEKPNNLTILSNVLKVFQELCYFVLVPEDLLLEIRDLSVPDVKIILQFLDLLLSILNSSCYSLVPHIF